uniref:Coat protein n=1 Tax=Colletotrichum cliviicola victorivirus 1 TaxID=3230497 RepID=A0AAU8EH01_9VIRU
MDAPIVSSLLAGVISAPIGGALADNQYRRYRSVVNSTASIGGAPDNIGKTILYEVGSRYKTRDAALQLKDPSLRHNISASYPTASVLRDDFLGLAKKYTNFSASFEFSSLAPLAERIALGLAVSSVFEAGVSSQRLAAGAPFAITALGTHATPVNASVTSIFIPRLADSVTSPDTFAVLAAAAASTGAAIVTDVLALDANNVPIVPTVDEAGFHDAAVQALRMIGANMIASDQGPLFALAVTRGVHNALSVVGHTDEGGVMRDVLRCGDHCPPFGGIHTGLANYSALPALSTGVMQNIAAYVDTIALTTAAAVAHCDPCVVHNEAVFPTVFVGTESGGAFDDPGDDTTGTPAMAARNRAQLLDSLPVFATDYIRALGTIFGAAGQTDAAVTFFTGSANYLNSNSRHLRYPSVAPYFWIEPTSLLPPKVFGTRAELNSFGSLAGRGATTSPPLFEGIELHSQVGEFKANYIINARSARTVPFLYHWLNNPQNGLGAIRPIQLDPQGIVHPGPSPGGDDVADRLTSGVDWAGYLWTRGQSPFPAPSEFINTNSYMGISVTHSSFDDDGNVYIEHLPTTSEMVSSTLKISSSALIGITSGQSNAPPREVRRARTRAAVALAAVRRRARRAPESSVQEMALSFTTPSLRRPATTPTNPPIEESEGTSGTRYPSDAGGSRGGPRATGAPPVPPAPQHEKFGAPRPQPASTTRPGAGGGQAPPPSTAQIPPPTGPLPPVPTTPPPADPPAVEPAPASVHPAALGTQGDA